MDLDCVGIRVRSFFRSVVWEPPECLLDSGIKRQVQTLQALLKIRVIRQQWRAAALLKRKRLKDSPVEEIASVSRWIIDAGAALLVDDGGDFLGNARC